MMASRVTPPAAEEEGVEEDRAEEGGATGAPGLNVSTCGHFNQS